MRLRVASLRWVVKRDLPIEFVPQELTSYGRLELLRRYLQRIDLPGRLRRTLAALSRLNHELVTDAITRFALPRLTIDVDGTGVRTGATVGWAFRGFNPHHRKDPSYYPLCGCRIVRGADGRQHFGTGGGEELDGNDGEAEGNVEILQRARHGFRVTRVVSRWMYDSL